MPPRRSPPTKAPPLNERIAKIMRLMAASRWTPSTTYELAEQWSCSVSTVRRAAGEASRRTHEGIALSDEMKDLIVLGIHTCASDADKIMAMHGARNPGIAVKAIAVKLDALKALAGVTGANAPQKHEITNDLASLYELACGSTPT